ncbi:hypothetical protein KBI23_19390 [bacterium]|nr:hypothetical protein [bacterium]
MKPGQTTFAAAEKYFYHAIDLSAVSRSVLRPQVEFSDSEWVPAYQWLEKETGFYPLFLAVGDESAAYVTGYQNQWRVNIGGTMTNGSYLASRRKAGEFPNLVLFAFRQSDLQGCFTDYQWWNIVLTDVLCERPIGPALYRYLFKKSWPRSKWLRTANADGHTVQLLVPELDLSTAAFVWARNQASAKALRAMGFENVSVKRLKLEH